MQFHCVLMDYLHARCIAGSIWHVRRQWLQACSLVAATSCKIKLLGVKLNLLDPSMLGVKLNLDPRFKKYKLPCRHVSTSQPINLNPQTTNHPWRGICPVDSLVWKEISLVYVASNFWNKPIFSTYPKRGENVIFFY